MNLGALLRARSYAVLAAALRETPDQGLREAWAPLGPMEKLALFKLLDPPRAMAFFETLPLADKVFLFSTATRAALGPWIEGLSASEKHLFHDLTPADMDRMTRYLETSNER